MVGGLKAHTIVYRTQSHAQAHAWAAVSRWREQLSPQNLVWTSRCPSGCINEYTFSYLYTGGPYSCCPWLQSSNRKQKLWETKLILEISTICWIESYLDTKCNHTCSFQYGHCFGSGRGHFSRNAMYRMFSDWNYANRTYTSIGFCSSYTTNVRIHISAPSNGCHDGADGNAMTNKMLSDPTHTHSHSHSGQPVYLYVAHAPKWPI